MRHICNIDAETIIASAWKRHSRWKLSQELNLESRQSYTSDFMPGVATWWVTLSLRCIVVALPGRLWAMTWASKPEIRNILHCRQSRTELRPQLTRTEYVVKFGREVFDTWADIHRPTDRLIAIRAGSEASFTGKYATEKRPLGKDSVKTEPSVWPSV